MALVNLNKIEKQNQKRQTVLSGRKGKTYADFIESQDGLNARAYASSSDPIIVSAANGYDNSRPKDENITLENSLEFNSLVPNATNFLGIKNNAGTAQAVVTQSEPVYDSIFGSDRENKYAASFNGTIGDTIFTDPYGNIYEGFNGAAIAAGHPDGVSNSFDFDGTDDYVKVSAKNVDLNSLKTWTIDCWFKSDVTTGLRNIFMGEYVATVGHTINLTKESDTGFRLSIARYPSSNLVNVSGISVPGMGTGWNHVALVSTGRNFKLFVNGMLRYVSSLTSYEDQVMSFKEFHLGAFVQIGAAASQFLDGQIANFRVRPYVPESYTTNTNVYGTGVFTPDTAPIGADTAIEDRYFSVPDRFNIRFDSSTSGKSQYKDPHGHELIFKTVGGNAANQPFITDAATEVISMPTGFTTEKFIKSHATQEGHVELQDIRFAKTWTLEAYVFMTTSGLNNNIFDTRTYANPNIGGIILRISIANQLNLFASSNNSTWNIAGPILGATTLSSSTWYHVALSFDGFSYKVYLNGILEATVSSALDVVSENKVSIGGRATESSDENFRGYILNPVLTPYAKYTSAFTPPAGLVPIEDIYYYDIVRAKMYKGYYQNWVAENTVFIGEVITSVDQCRRVITYALNGETFIDNVDSRGNNNFNGYTIYDIEHLHAIGCDKVRIDYYAIVKRTGEWNGRGAGEKVITFAVTQDSTMANGSMWHPISNKNRNVMRYTYGDSHNFGAVNGVGQRVINNVQDNVVKFQFKITRDF